MKKAYLVAVPTVTNPDMFAKEYASKVADTLKPFDGKFLVRTCLLYTSPSPRDFVRSRMPSSA